MAHQRHMLFLQGLPGPFFARLAKSLRDKGICVSRINFNVGDCLDWRGGGATLYRGNAQDWPAFLNRYIHDHDVTDIIGFGACRPMHRVVTGSSEHPDIGIFMFDEGYIRPNHITLEWHDALGQQPMLPRLWMDAPVSDQPEAQEFEHHFYRRMRESVFYWLAATLGTPLVPQYKSHRYYAAHVEMWAWCKRWSRRKMEHRDSKAVLASLNGKPFFLFPLQLDGDAQLVFRSPFASMMAAVDHVLSSFAQYADNDQNLLIKRHPLDPDAARWRDRIAAAVAQYGLHERVHYIDRADLDPLLTACEGVVTVNSSVGPLALQRGKPVHVLGDAVYAVEPLIGTKTLDQFWASPIPPSEGAYPRFIQALMASCQVAGGLHDDIALTSLVHNSMARLLMLDKAGRIQMRKAIMR